MVFNIKNFSIVLFVALVACVDTNETNLNDPDSDLVDSNDDISKIVDDAEQQGGTAAALSASNALTLSVDDVNSPIWDTVIQIPAGAIPATESNVVAVLLLNPPGFVGGYCS